MLKAARKQASKHSFMNSLKIKFLGLCCIILMVAIGLTTWYNLQTQKAMLSKLATEHGRLT